MDRIKETGRKSVCVESEGLACGPVGHNTIDAEIMVDDNGKTVYLHAQWVDEVPDELLLEASKESLYDIYVQLNETEGEEFSKLIGERDRINKTRIVDDSRYQFFYDELRKMVEEEIESNGMEIPNWQN